jgi:hypothetical protein
MLWEHLDAARIKGIHQARFRMLCAKHLAARGTVKGYDAARRLPGSKPLQEVRNIGAGLSAGFGSAY